MVRHNFGNERDTWYRVLVLGVKIGTYLIIILVFHVFFNMCYPDLVDNCSVCSKHIYQT